MIFLAMFLFAGSSAYVASRIAPPLLLVLVIGYPLAGFISGINWLDNKTGVNSFLLSSWVWISGVQYPDPIIGKGCQDYMGGGDNFNFFMFILGLVVLLLLLVLAIIMTLMALVCMVAVPASVVISSVASIVSIAKNDAEAFIFGMTVLAGTMATVIATGLVIRLLHVLAAGIMPCT